MKATETVPARLWNGRLFNELRREGCVRQALYLLSTWRKNPSGIFRLTGADIAADCWSSNDAATEAEVEAGAVAELKSMPESFVDLSVEGWVWVRPMSAIHCGWPKCSASDRAVLVSHLLESPEPLVLRWLDQYGQSYGVTHKALGLETPPEAKGYTPGFEEFWSRYPKKHNKAAAFREWRKLLNAGYQFAELMTALQVWSGAESWRKGYVHNADRWLRDMLWKENPSVRPSPDNPRGGQKPWQKPLVAPEGD